ncbi:MAG: hypothetical protein BZ151_08850 [Desulfobacca sp. 4484_104]|nr:MAG: hypothetical protein BZ151_08850 [Desulfobacca sp. 4484_104]RLA87322.1 MAG: hypothetical protein DRG58_10850 [Deltaproteobacteria bacterium]
MAEVIELKRFRQKMAADRGFRTWLARFREQFGPGTRFQDLSDQTLLILAMPGEENLFVFIDLVMGAQGLGDSTSFRLADLEISAKEHILDLALGLLDRARFEVMRRLGWVSAVPDGSLPIIEFLPGARPPAGSETVKLPALAPEHPQFAEYQALPPHDQGIFIRRLIPRAVREFRRRLAGP